MGYLFGEKVAGGKWVWGVILAFPAILLILYRIFNVHVESAGVEPYITLLLLPMAACLGMYLRINHYHHKHNLIDEHFFNE